jgi:hypothetical protein
LQLANEFREATAAERKEELVELLRFVAGEVSILAKIRNDSGRLKMLEKEPRNARLHSHNMR